MTTQTLKKLPENSCSDMLAVMYSPRMMEQSDKVKADIAKFREELARDLEMDRNTPRSERPY